MPSGGGEWLRNQVSCPKHFSCVWKMVAEEIRYKKDGKAFEKGGTTCAKALSRQSLPFLRVDTVPPGWEETAKVKLVRTVEIQYRGRLDPDVQNRSEVNIVHLMGPWSASVIQVLLEYSHTLICLSIAWGCFHTPAELISSKKPNA